MNIYVLQTALDNLTKARALLRVEGCVVADDLNDPIKQLADQIAEMMIARAA